MARRARTKGASMGHFRLARAGRACMRRWAATRARRVPGFGQCGRRRGAL